MGVVWFTDGLFLLLVFWGICIFNRLVIQKNDVKNAWSQIDLQHKDSVPGDTIPFYERTCCG